MGAVPYSYLVDDHWNEIIAELLKYRADLVLNGKIIHVRFARTATGKNHAQYAQERATRALVLISADKTIF
jgi:GTP-binding protein EngB required for normal cell division